MAVGIPVGVDADFRRTHYGFPGWGTAYVFGLTLLLVTLALLTLGLVRPWGEVLPKRIPFIGDKRVPPLAAVIPAGTAALALTLLWASAFYNFGDIFVLYGLDGAERIVVLACYAPLLLWGPLLASVTLSYATRTGVPNSRAGESAPPPVEKDLIDSKMPDESAAHVARTTATARSDGGRWMRSSTLNSAGSTATWAGLAGAPMADPDPTPAAGRRLAGR